VSTHFSEVVMRKPLTEVAMKLRLALLAVPFLTLACSDAEQTTLVEPPADAALAGINLAAHAGINQELAAVRRATASFHNFDKATAAGYGVQLTDCLEQLPDGAQGYHFGNPALIDGTASLLEPEILQYEPQAGGRLRLVGVEYIVPLNFPQPPPLLGQQFHANEAAGLWALHVWAWRHNPSGMFEDWNPKVSCEHAE
jgi:hypothetical protein